jgi:hypothetical protein
MQKVFNMIFWTPEGDTTDGPSLVKSIYNTAYEN